MAVKKTKTASKKRKPKKITPGKKDGRPAKEISWLQLHKLLYIQCTQEEICAVLNVSIKPLNEKIKEHCIKEYGKKGCKEKFGTTEVTFSKYSERFYAAGKRSLRRKQFSVAMAGDTKMLIHLGKHWVNQIDKAIVDNMSSDGSMTPKQITRVIVDSNETKSN